MTPERTAALELAMGQPATPKSLERVSRQCGPEAARWAFEQWALRKRARGKFPVGSEDMLFDRDALEQATHQAVAEYRASRFPPEVLVADLTCSIGSDLIAIASRGEAVGIDSDRGRLELAAHNLGVHGLRAQLVLSDCLEMDWAFDFAFADPARRINGKRTLNLNDFQPNPSALADRLSRLNLAAMKLTPMLPDSQLLDLSDSLEFWSYGGEAREAVL